MIRRKRQTITIAPREPMPTDDGGWVELRVEDERVGMYVEPDDSDEHVASTLILLLDARQHRRERPLRELGLVDLGGEG